MRGDLHPADPQHQLVGLDVRARRSGSHQDSADIRIASEERSLHQWRVCDLTGGALGISGTASAAHFDRNELGRALSVTHQLARERRRDFLDRAIEHELVARTECAILCRAAPHDDDRIVGRHIAVNGNRVKTRRQRGLERFFQESRRDPRIRNQVAEHRRHLRRDHADTLHRAGERDGRAARLEGCRRSLGTRVGRHDRVGKVGEPVVAQRSNSFGGSVPEFLEVVEMADHAGRRWHDEFRCASEELRDVRARVTREPHPFFAGKAVGASRVRDHRLQASRLDAFRRHIDRRGFHAIRAEYRGCGARTISGDDPEIESARLGFQARADASESKSAHCGRLECDVHLKSGSPRHLPWQRLYFLPEPQGHGSLRPTLFSSRLAGAAA